MNEISKRTDTAIQKTNHQTPRQTIIDAYATAPLVELTDQEVFTDLVVLLQETAQLMGLKNTFAGDFTDEEIQLMLQATATDIIRTIRQFYGGLRRSELKIIFRFGRVGELGESYGLTSSTVITWIKNYFTKLRQPSLISHRENQTEKILSEQEQKQRMQEWDKISKEEISKFFWSSVSTGEYEFKKYSKKLAYYSFFERHGIIKLDNEQKKAIHERIRDQYIANKTLKGERDKSLKNFHNGIGPAGSHKSAVANECKIHVFDQYMKMWITKKLDIDKIMQKISFD